MPPPYFDPVGGWFVPADLCEDRGIFKLQDYLDKEKTELKEGLWGIWWCLGGGGGVPVAAHLSFDGASLSCWAAGSLWPQCLMWSVEVRLLCWRTSCITRACDCSAC